jgi:hypothetical protein
MQSAHGVTLAAAPQKPRRTSQFSSHPRGRGGASAACAPELSRERAARPGQRAPESFAFRNALRQRGTRQSATARGCSSRRQRGQPARRRAAQQRSVSRTVMRRVTPVKGWASHRAAYGAPDQAPRASAAHPDVTPRARVPSAACTTTALQRAHRPRAAPHCSVPARAAQRASCLSGAPRLPSRRPACGNESGLFAACRRARCVLQVAPPPSPPCQAPRRAFSARKRVVGRLRASGRRSREPACESALGRPGGRGSGT